MFLLMCLEYFLRNLIINHHYECFKPYYPISMAILQFDIKSLTVGLFDGSSIFAQLLDWRQFYLY